MAASTQDADDADGCTEAAAAARSARKAQERCAELGDRLEALLALDDDALEAASDELSAIKREMVRIQTAWHNELEFRIDGLKRRHAARRKRERKN